MFKSVLTSVPALALLLSAPVVEAAELTLLRTFQHPGPSGLAYDEQYCGIWIANESRTIMMVTPYGDDKMRFESELSRVDAIAVFDGHLVLSDGNGLYQNVDRMGTPVSDPYRLAGNLMDTDGLFVDNVTKDYWVADDSIAQLVRIGADGTITQRLDGMSQTPQLMEPQGVTRDPVSGNLLVVDDADASDSLFEFSESGVLLDVISLTNGGHDAEGITVQPDTRTVFVAYDDGDVVAAFHYEPTASADHAPFVPQPGGCVISSLTTDLPQG